MKLVDGYCNHANMLICQMVRPLPRSPLGPMRVSMMWRLHFKLRRQAFVVGILRKLLLPLVPLLVVCYMICYRFWKQCLRVSEAEAGEIGCFGPVARIKQAPPPPSPCCAPTCAACACLPSKHICCAATCHRRKLPSVQVHAGPGLTDNLDTQIVEGHVLDDPLLHELVYRGFCFRE